MRVAAIADRTGLGEYRVFKLELDGYCVVAKWAIVARSR
jgi:hypothetical protein